jgi:hypothetical protein
MKIFLAIAGALVLAVILGVICGVASAIIEHNQDPNDPFNPYAYEDEY